MPDTFATSSALSGVPPPWKPRAPAGVTVIVFPTEPLTSSVFASTAFIDKSITIASAIERARIATIETVRMVLRKAFLVPRATTLIEDAVCASHPVG